MLQNGKYGMNTFHHEIPCIMPCIDASCHVLYGYFVSYPAPILYVVLCINILHHALY